MNTHILYFLPAEFEHEIVSCEIIEENNWKAVIHTECDASQMCDKWVSKFSSSSLCIWRVRKKLILLGFTPPAEGFPWDDLREIFIGCQWIDRVPNAVEILPKNFNCLGRVHERYPQTDDRQTDSRTFCTFCTKYSYFLY